MRLVAPALMCLLLTACAAKTAAVQPPRLPAGTFGIGREIDAGALAHAEWTFADPNRIDGDPVSAAKAVVAVEYLADDLRADPKWVWMPPSTRERMLIARTQLRDLLGVRPDAPPQAVVDALLAAADALRAGKRDAALTALSNPVFTRPPGDSLAILTRMPFLSDVAVAANLAYSGQFPTGVFIGRHS